MSFRPPLLGRLLLKLRPLGQRRCDVEADLRELFEERVSTFGQRHASWRYLQDAASLWLHRFPAPDIITAPRRRSRGHMRQDIVFALRLFRKQPGLFGMAVLGLAVAMGISATTFGIVNATLLRSSGVPEPSALLRASLNSGGNWMGLTGDSRHIGNWPYLDYLRLPRDGMPMSLAASSISRRTFRIGQEAAITTESRVVTGNFFATVGVTAERGRVLAPDDDSQAGAPTVVIGHAFWKNWLASDPDIVGKSAWIDDQAYTIVGVLSRRFTDIDPNRTPAFWTTMGSEASAMAAGSLARGGVAQVWNPAVDVVGRLEHGASASQALSALTSRASALQAESAVRQAQPVAVELGRADAPSQNSTSLAAIVTSVIALVVLLAAVNLANVLLANASGRSREIGTRLAIGAGRARIVRQLVTESVILCTLGGIGGFALTQWLTPAIAAFVQLPPAFDLSPDLRLLAFIAVLALGVGLVAGLAPARHVRREDLMLVIKTDRLGTPVGVHPGRLRSLLVGIQAGASIVLLTLAALFGRSAAGVVFRDSGIAVDRIITVGFDLGRGYDAARTTTFLTAAVGKVRQLPEVADATLAAFAPSELGPIDTIDGRFLYRNLVSSEYFTTVGRKILRGRPFADTDIATAAPVAIISNSLAKQYWGTEDPLGSSLERVWGMDDPTGTGFRGILGRPAGTRVIGVVEDAVMNLRNHEALAAYTPLSPLAAATRIVVRTRRDPASVVPLVVTAIRSVDRNPDISVQARLASEDHQRELRLPVTLAALSVALGAVALVLATIGTFGVTAFIVSQRQHEVGVRMTLGASGTAILRMLLVQGLRPILAGLGGGLVLSLLIGQLIQRGLYGISGHDPIALIGAVVVLLGAATSAILIPARRAARIDPAKMLRES